MITINQFMLATVGAFKFCCEDFNQNIVQSSDKKPCAIIHCTCI